MQDCDKFNRTKNFQTFMLVLLLTSIGKIVSMLACYTIEEKHRAAQINTTAKVKRKTVSYVIC
jgi:hypothetical protein